MTQVFESTDVGSSEALLRQYYSSMRLQVTGERHLMRFIQHQVGRVRLDRNTFRMDLDLEADPLGTIVVARVVGGRASYGRGADERRYERGDVYVTAQPDDGFFASLRDYEGEIAVLEPDLLGEVAEAAPGSHEPVRLLDHSPISTVAADMWWRTYTFLLASSRASTADSVSPIYQQEATRLLVAATLAAFPTNAVFEPSAVDRHDAHPATLRRATEYIEGNAQRDITIKDIAEAAGVTTRAVQLSFRRYLDTTPTTYLRKVRLDYVRAGLIDGSPELTTVTSIAGRWGFSNFGRFAAQYRAEFGELPGQTLRR